MRLLELGMKRVSGISVGLNLISWKEVMSFPCCFEMKLSQFISTFYLL